MHDHIRAERKRVLQPRRAERRVDGQDRAPRMRLLREGRNVVGLARGVHRRLEVHHVALAQTRGIPDVLLMQVDDLETVQLPEQIHHCMAPVVARADGDDVRPEVGEQRVEGSQAGRVGQGACFEERREEGFEPGGIGRREAGVDVRCRERDLEFQGQRRLQLGCYMSLVRSAG